MKMGAPRKRPVIKSRRRVEEEGEEEDTTVQAPEEDSLTEGSVGSHADDDADSEGSDDSGTGPSLQEQVVASTLINGHQGKVEKSISHQSADLRPPTLITAVDDTDAMMNGLKISQDTEAEEIKFDDMTDNLQGLTAPEIQNVSSHENPVDRRRREHEEYKKRRDADPAFVPNRGGFFMHDHRSAGPGQNGFRPFGRGAVRGRGAPRGYFQGPTHFQLSGPADAPWAHDLHDTVAERDGKHVDNRPPHQNLQSKQQDLPSNSQPPNRTFSTTTRLGDMQVRVFIQGMAEAKYFSNVARYSYTRLPYHRPPLRRDKPVRISIPQLENKYRFPVADRSFIFIPRAMRPNQQGYGKARGRGSFGAGYVSFGPLSSRKTSVYGGSTYSPSAVLSRRSSLAREITAPGIASPQQPSIFQQSAVTLDAGKPVVRLPPAAQQLQQQAMDDAPTVKLPNSSAYIPPQRPAYQENRPEDLPMHHPKPERSLQVADIVSPSAADYNSPATQQQPFHQQVPMHFAPHTYATGQQQYAHSRHPSHPSQASGGTPLPQIPEAAIHAQPFQPFGYPPPQGFYPSQYPMYYYPPAGSGTGSPAAGAPPFIPGQQYFYPMAVPPPPPPPPQAEPETQADTFAHEAGGMVYYYKPSELPAGSESVPSYQQNYTTAAGIQSIMSPAYYHQNPAYYPPPPPQPPPQPQQ